MKPDFTTDRRTFLRRLAGAAAAVPMMSPALRAQGRSDPIIDIHQHTTFRDRSDADLIAHQDALGITRTFLLPAGRLYGLAAGAGGNQTVLRLARIYPERFSFFANEVADLPDARQEIEKYLKLGAIGIGELKFRVDCDSREMRIIYDLAREYRVPVLLHFTEGVYNSGFDRLGRMLEAYSDVTFIGHATTWWAAIDNKHNLAERGYPAGDVTPGGLTDRYLSDYPNMYGDLSATSGNNALTRDEEHGREFLQRHQDKLLFGSDCFDTLGRGPGCIGARQIATIRRLAPSRAIQRKVLFENARRVLRLDPAG